MNPNERFVFDTNVLVICVITDMLIDFFGTLVNSLSGPFIPPRINRYSRGAFRFQSPRACRRIRHSARRPI
jgi:hypothetical protein